MKVKENIAKSIARKSGTLFLVFIRKATRTIVKIKDNHPDRENERNKAITESAERAPNMTRSHKVTHAIKTPKRTGIIKPM